MQTPAADIAQLIETFKRAAFDKDVSRFLSLYDENVIIFDLWQTWEHRGIAAWRIAVVEWFTSTGENRDAVSFEEVSVAGNGDVCFVHAMIKFSCVSPEGNVLRAMHERLTWGLVKKTSWKIVHQHTSAPVDGADCKLIFEKN